jgi:hypothetical protein
MNRVAAVGLMMVLAMFVSVGCKKQDVAADQAAIELLVRQDTAHFAAGTQHDSAGGSLVDGDTAFMWWRGAQTHDSAPGIEVAISGDSATVTWSQHNYGWFEVLVRPVGETLQLWNKPLQEKVQLSAIFTRSGPASDADRGWQFQRISLANGRSDSVQSVRIDSLRLQSSLQNTLIRDPLATFYRSDSLVSFTPGELVTLTLYTNATAGKAFLHTFVLAWPFYIRLEFTDQGDGVYQGSWHAQGFPSFRFGIFDLMARTTIYERDGAYDFNGWLFPYRIATAD